MKNRHSNRLSNYDYSQNGIYFVTICTKNREELFGEIIDGKMALNDAGKIVLQELNDIKNHSPGVHMDQYIIMPNHVHLIIEIISHVGADLASAQNIKITKKYNNGQTQGLSLQNINNIGLLSRIIQAFKSKSTVKYIHLMKSINTACITKIWQRSFYDRIIRNETELKKIREYIFKNPDNLERDRNHLENILI